MSDLPPTTHRRTEAEADERARRIASIAAEGLVRCEGRPTSTPDEFVIPLAEFDGHLRECVEHLVWQGEVVITEAGDDLVVLFWDVTMGSPRAN